MPALRERGRASGSGTESRPYGDEDLHVAIAAIAVPNPASIALHERFDFAPAGLLRDIGRKFDRYWDVAWYEKRLP